MPLKCKVVLVWVTFICLSCEVVLTGCELVWLNRNVTDNFRVGEDGCTNDASVCTNFGATCHSDGSCLCISNRPSYRNPVIEVNASKIVYGNSYGCIDNDIFRFNVIGYIGISSCGFKPFQVVPYRHKDPVTTFSHSGQVFSCSLTKAHAKFPDNATEIELQWLDESYVDLNVSNNNLYFKWRRSVPNLQGTIITFTLGCLVPSRTNPELKANLTKCLRAKVLGTWSAEANPTDLIPLVTYEPTTSVLNPSDTVTLSSTSSAPVTAEPKSTASISLEEECTCSNKVFIALFSISLVANALLGIIVGFQKKKMQRNPDKNLQKEDLRNTNEQTRANSGKEITAYEEVVIDSGIHNDGINGESFPSSGHNNNNGDHKYEEPSNYEPLRRNPLQDQSDEHNYQSLTTSQRGK